ncbi:MULTISPECIES: hypothetical protein [unclassified Rhodococcus (in: high G+C Gram-positive bacteria)]|uniref:hypothetical protein n=1 Tax=unclassified Rhodococcus (in: high G+C Gram-positive bacteria) TaxID=192944 RepID=UPI001C532517|nr:MULTISPECIES: hypothetical protein [unclassified Rhodococcus (in: high G+C Gram-positive bacteria)]
MREDAGALVLQQPAGDGIADTEASTHTGDEDGTPITVRAELSTVRACTSNVECAVGAVAPENPQFTALRLWTSVHGIAALNSTHAFEPVTDLSAVTELTRRAVRDVIADATEPGT